MMVKYKVRGDYKVFGKYFWHIFDAKNPNDAKKKFLATLGGNPSSAVKWDKLVAKKLSIVKREK
jgi:hypothetical protein